LRILHKSDKKTNENQEYAKRNLSVIIEKYIVKNENRENEFRSLFDIKTDIKSFRKESKSTAQNDFYYKK